LTKSALCNRAPIFFFNAAIDYIHAVYQLNVSVV